jgi:predicted CXXCH cytochrome family protein
MAVAVWVLIPLGGASLLLLLQLGAVCGRWRGTAATGGIVAAFAGAWWLLGRAAPSDRGPADWSAVASVTSDACACCHADHYESWKRTYHRTMTRDAMPEFVKGDFDNAFYECQGVTTRLWRDGDAFFMETVDPGWASRRAGAGARPASLPPPRATFRVDRLVGSHWIQECMHRDENGRYSRLPVLYHIVEKRWVHANGAFLAPDSADFWAQCRGSAWNDSCLYCHNTGPSKNPLRNLRGQIVAYNTAVVELGIACEACHGPGGEHVRLNRNPARRYALQAARGASDTESTGGDPSIVYPARLPVPRRDEICARCHGALVPKADMWDPRTHRDPYIAGQELLRYNDFFWSEAEQALLARGGSGATTDRRPAAPEPGDGRFWPDGTPLTTALEYNGMARSACYQHGNGKLSCLSCHTMHGDDPNFMLKPGMQSNEACFGCHGDYRARLPAHTHHAADSPGSLCYNCHMPHLVYSLLTTHRSHRIEIPDVQVSRESGKPHACNLCHLDKSLGWTQEQLAQWSDRHAKRQQPLTAEEVSISSALLLLAKGDARVRAIVAGALSNPAAQRASGTGWTGSFLTRLLEHERYPAVRYLAHRGLRSAHGETAAGPFDYLATPAVRAEQLRALRVRYDAAPPLLRPPHLPLTAQGLPNEDVLRRLLEQRHDPDVTIHE